MRYAAQLLRQLLFLAVRGKLALVRTGRPALQVGRGLLMLAMSFFFITTFGNAPRAGFLAVFWVAPLMMLALAALLQGDVGHWLTWLAAGVALAAVWLTLPPVIAAILQPWLTGVGPGRSLLAGGALALVAALLAWWSTQALQNGESLVEMRLERGG